MKKQLSILTLSLAMIASSIATVMPVSAETYVPVMEAAYTVEDLLAINTEMEAEMADLCDTDFDCLQGTYYFMIMDDDRYSVLHNFFSTPFVISSINPSENTLSVIFHQKEGINKWKQNPQINTLKELRLGWFDAGTPTSNEAIPANAEEAPGTFHFLYSGDASTYGEGWFSSGEEIDIPVTSTKSLVLNTDGLIKVNFKASNSAYNGYIDYSDCLNDPSYQTGDECKTLFTKNFGQIHVPYRNGIPSFSVSSSSEEGKGGESDTGDSPADEITSDESINDTTFTDNETVNNENTTANTAATTTASVPTSNAASFVATTVDESSSSDSSENLSSAEDTSSEVDGIENKPTSSKVVLPLSGEEEVVGYYNDFPWWFIVLVLACDGIIMWLFWPKNRKKC